MIPTYSTIEKVYERYKSPYTRISFEGRIYHFTGIENTGDIKRHVYRNDEERHTLKIHLQGGVPFYVDARYIIQQTY